MEEMKILRKIPLEPENGWIELSFGLEYLKQLYKGSFNHISDYELSFVVKLLVHKINELTEEVERIKEDK